MYLQFPHQQYIYQLPADAETAVGTFTLAESCEIEHIVFDYYYHNLQAAAFTMQVKIYGSALAGTPLATSDTITISPTTLSSTAGLNRIGLFFADFDRKPLKEGLEYHVKVETTGNTSTDASYFGLILDWYNEVNDAAVAGQAGARMHILGRETI